MKRILHITYDYPSVITPKKTPAIKNLVEGTKNKYKNTVIVLNRVSRLAQEKILSEENLYLINTFGLPKGMFFRHTITRSIDKVKYIKHKYDLDYQWFDLIHAHKLCFEGPIAAYISKEYNIPLVVSVRGSDFPVLKFRFDLRNYYKLILKEAKQIFIISPWMDAALVNIFQRKFYEEHIKSKLICLGSIVSVDLNLVDSEDKRITGKLVTVFKMTKRSIKVKNIERVLKAFKKARIILGYLTLDIIGDGKGRDKIETLVKKLGLENEVNLRGDIDNFELNDILYKYSAYIMASYPETFGITYIEALRNGLPIIYAKGMGVDGFFPEEIGIKVNPFSIHSIHEGILRVIRMNKEYKNNVSNYVKSGGLQQFSRESVIRKYCKVIDSIIT